MARLPDSIGGDARGRVARAQSRRAPGRDSAAMDVRSMCSRRLVTADRLAPLTEAARLMREHHVGSVVVTRPTPEGLRTVGNVTDRDLAVEVLARAGDGVPGSSLAALVGEQALVGISEDAPLGEAILRMRESGVRRLLVRSEQGLLVGLLSFDDVLQACAAQLTGLAAVLPRARQRETLRRKPVAVPRPALPVALPPMGNGGWMQDWTAPLATEEQDSAAAGVRP
ncbi:MAG: CBS domain-containing protein [Betaproteobacteria bacterium]